ncbi:hypothetical protein EN816_07275 [Mesorhizobium sp. M8A.F.Ca.ET.173.01.1.1]|nr:hypothetical protein EN816_07275 [Mesorhizobium sp. M8A.F.Ca.ET.173.01.1.1]
MTEKHQPIEPPKDRTLEDLGRNTLINLIEQIPFASLVTPTVDAAMPSKAREEEARWQRDVSAVVNTTVSRVEVIERFLAASITAHTYQKQAGKAGELSFFRGGMVSTLEKIGSGDATAKDTRTLARQLKESQRDVDEIIGDIELAMSKFVDGDPFKDRLHQAIYGKFGKLTIRERIASVTETDWRDLRARSLARALCEDIDKFNRSVVALAQEAADAHPMESSRTKG